MTSTAIPSGKEKAEDNVFDEQALDQKLEQLNAILGSMDLALIGYSGGVDSALLAVAAHRVLGDKAIAVTADSASYASGELERAQEITGQFGIRHEVVRTDELQNPQYAENPTNRCYFCKQALFVHMGSLAQELSASHILYGQNADDVGDFRPGAQAAQDYGVRAPLQEAGFTKNDVRQLARRWHVPVWNRPAMACLSSRFPYGTPIDAEQLRQVDRAEAFLRQLGYQQLRVRHHTDIARLELPAEDLETLLKDSHRCASIAAALAEIGYRHVSADLRGFRSGSLNEVLLPAAAAAAETERQLEKVLASHCTGPHHSQSHGQILLLSLDATDVASLAETAPRLALVQALENLGVRYTALDLALPG
jgi:pyridinium-3,5-biscarboxylic acid mononucleotide sulfurtransferase